MNWETAFTELNTSVVGYFGETVDYLSLDTLTAVNDISATLNRGGDDGTAEFNMPVASVAVPAFGDKITDPDAVEWRISEIRQKFSDRTPCILRRSDFWFTIDAEQSDGSVVDGDTVWTDHTTGITAMIVPVTSAEVIDEDDSRLANVFEVHTQYLATLNHKMRFQWGSRRLYVTGIRSDETNALKTIFDCIEEEA